MTCDTADRSWSRGRRPPVRAYGCDPDDDTAGDGAMIDADVGHDALGGRRGWEGQEQRGDQEPDRCSALMPLGRGWAEPMPSRVPRQEGACRARTYVIAPRSGLSSGGDGEAAGVSPSGAGGTGTRYSHKDARTVGAGHLDSPRARRHFGPPDAPGRRAGVPGRTAHRNSGRVVRAESRDSPTPVDTPYVYVATDPVFLLIPRKRRLAWQRISSSVSRWSVRATRSPTST